MNKHMRKIMTVHMLRNRYIMPSLSQELRSLPLGLPTSNTVITFFTKTDLPQFPKLSTLFYLQLPTQQASSQVTSCATKSPSGILSVATGVNRGPRCARTGRPAPGQGASNLSSRASVLGASASVPAARQVITRVTTAATGAAGMVTVTVIGVGTRGGRCG